MKEHAGSLSLADERDELTSKASLNGKPRRRAVAYIADFTAVDGAGILFDQKAVIDSYALDRDVEVSRYVIDSGQLDKAALVGHGLEGLVRTIRCSGETVIVVEHVSRFAVDYAVALRVAATLSAWGIAVHEARGGPAFVERDLALTLAADAFETKNPSPCPAPASRRKKRSFPMMGVVNDA